MNKEELQKFEKYYFQEFSERDHNEFSNELDRDAALHDRYDKFRYSMNLIHKDGIKNEIREIHSAQTSQEKSNSRMLKYKWGAVAAAITAFIIISVYQPQSSWSLEDLVMTHFEAYPNIITVRGDAQDEAIAAYSNKKYDEAANKFLPLAVHSDTSMLYLLISLCAHKGAPLDADLVSRIFFYADNSHLYQQIRWYGALYFINNNEESDAIELLQQIEDGEFNHDRAKTILKKIDR